MIQANELRIGNYVSGQAKQITKVDGFFNNNKAIYTNVEDERVRFIIHYLNECEGVELTEEILLKCGFLNWNGYYSKGDIKYEEENIILNFWSDDSYIIDDIKYLHQLQNLYFALSGEELNIEL